MDKQVTPFRIKHNFKKYFLNTIVPTLFNAVIIGILVGTVVWAYNFCAEHVMEFSYDIYAAVNKNIYFLPLLLLGVGALAGIMALALKFIPEMAGSGIPYTEGVMRGQLKYQKVKMFFGTIVLSFISFFAGLPLGAEGPSVQLGGIIGDSVSGVETKINPHAKATRRLAITSGASSALAVAFNAPLTGIIFALEEGHKRFSPTILLSVASTVIFSVLTSRLLHLWTGLKSSFNFFIFDLGDMEMLPMGQIWMLVILGIFVGLFACIFTLLIRYVNKFTERYNIKRVYRLVAAFLLVGIAGVFVSDIIGGGSSIIHKFSVANGNVSFLILLLILKLVLVALCTNSGSTGGLFVPMLAIGALLGAVVSNLFMKMGMDAEAFKVIVVISMSAFMAAVVRAPLTGIILIAEITGQLLSGFLQTAIVVVIAYLIVELFNVKPIYDELLDATLKRLNKDKERRIVKITETIDAGSFATGRSVRDILWPAGCHVDKIIKMDHEGKIVTRGDKDGERQIFGGDIYIIHAETYDVESTLDELHALIKVGKDYEYQLEDLDQNDESIV